MLHAGGGETLVVRELIGGGERVEVPDEREEELAVGDEIVGVRQPVALDVGPRGIFWIGPPVIALRGEIVQPARAARIARGRDGLGRDGEGGIGLRDEARPLVSGEFEGGQDREGEEGEHK